MLIIYNWFLNNFDDKKNIVAHGLDLLHRSIDSICEGGMHWDSEYTAECLVLNQNNDSPCKKYVKNSYWCKICTPFSQRIILVKSVYYVWQNTVMHFDFF